MTTEQWRVVEGYDGLYSVSSIGRIRVNYVTASIAEKTRAARPVANSTGYYMASLRNKRFYIHRLVATAFIPNPNSYPQVNHIDGNKLNNAVDNLEWTTARGNLLHRSRVLGKEIGDNHHGAKLDALKVHEIRRLLTDGMGREKIGNRFGVSRAVIWNIEKGNAWFHVPVLEARAR